MAAIEPRLKEEFGEKLPGGHSGGWGTKGAPKDLRKSHNPGESQAWGGQPSQRPPEHSRRVSSSKLPGKCHMVRMSLEVEEKS